MCQIKSARASDGIYGHMFLRNRQDPYRTLISLLLFVFCLVRNSCIILVLLVPQGVSCEQLILRVAYLRGEVRHLRALSLRDGLRVVGRRGVPLDHLPGVLDDILLRDGLVVTELGVLREILV